MCGTILVSVSVFTSTLGNLKLFILVWKLNVMINHNLLPYCNNCTNNELGSDLPCFKCHTWNSFCLRRIASPRSNFLDMEKLTFQDYYSLKLQWHWNFWWKNCSEKPCCLSLFFNFEIPHLVLIALLVLAKIFTFYRFSQNWGLN